MKCCETILVNLVRPKVYSNVKFYSKNMRMKNQLNLIIKMWSFSVISVYKKK